MIPASARCYPELTTRGWLRDRPFCVELLANNVWQVRWRSGRITSYEHDPRGDLSLSYEPKSISDFR
jgi:hypothetical protein